MATIRTLRAGEEEALLDLLDAWDLPDGWRGRDFFRRYVEQDPTFAPENVWVAARDGVLQACVQIFPRRLRGAAGALPAGGIGSVFTLPAARGRGLASAVLARATRAMRERSCEVALLFTGRVDFYAARGWSEWALRGRWIERPFRPPPPPADAIEVADFDAARDLAAVRDLHAAYDADRVGPVLRDEAGWRASLRIAGNPREDFRVARDAAGAPRAYVRAVSMEGALIVTELARAARAADAAAALLAALLEPRDPDPLATPGRDRAALRARTVLPGFEDPALEAALAARGLASRTAPWPGVMLRCVDAAALARRLGAPAPADPEAEGALLRRALPPERFTFWPADRF